MIRLLTIFAGAAVLAAGAAWIANLKGALTFLIGVYEVRMSASVAIALLLLFALLVILFTRGLMRITGTPGAISRWWGANRNRRGNLAIARGLVAAAAGDALEARRQATKAQSLIGQSPLALLLRAQAAQLEGDDIHLENAYRMMLANPETEFLGLRGLYVRSMRNDDGDLALSLAERAHALKPRAAWAANALFDLTTVRRKWSEASEILDSMARAGLVDMSLLRRRRAVLLAAQALDADSRGESDDALRLSLEALALAPGLAPAAILAARKLAATGRSWRAQDVIEAAWQQSPHPDLAAVYAAIQPDDSAATRAKRMMSLACLNRDHFESRILEAEQAVNLANWPEARRVLAPLARGSVSARVCALMAEIEQGERHDAAAAHGWISRAVRAPRDAEWRCGNCSWSSTKWRAVCGHCQAFDTLSWTASDGDLDEALEEIADEGLIASAPPRIPRKPPLGAAHSEGLVILPRPPDDPGPGGQDYEPDVGKGGKR